MKALVVGYGSIGKRHINNLSSFPKIQIFVCTNRRIDNFLRKKRCTISNSLDDCIQKKPDFAIVSNETNLHFQTSLKLAKAGIDIFIEKPLSHNMTGIANLLKTIKQKKLVTLIGCDLRFHPGIKKIKELINEGVIGKIIAARAENGSYLPEWHPYEDYRKSYASRKDLGGGVILTCIHEIDYLYWFFGQAKEVLSLTGKFSSLDINVEDLCIALLKFKNNIFGEVHLNYFKQPAFQSCKIIGTKGTIYWDSDINVVKVFNTKKKKWMIKKTLKNYDFNRTYMDELNHFISCIKSRRKTINPATEGANTLRIAMAIKKASNYKKAIKLD